MERQPSPVGSPGLAGVGSASLAARQGLGLGLGLCLGLGLGLGLGSRQHARDSGRQADGQPEHATKDEISAAAARDWFSVWRAS